MNWNSGIRQFHRWVSVAFTLTVIANFVARGMNPGVEPPMWITLSPLAPLALLFLTGAYLFALPYLLKRRAARGK